LTVPIENQTIALCIDTRLSSDDTEHFSVITLIAQLKGCLLDCSDWESNYCAVH